MSVFRVRPAEPSDIDALVDFGVRALQLSPSPGLDVDAQKLRVLASHCVCGQWRLGGPRTFAQVAAHADRPSILVAACLAEAAELACYRGGEVTVMQLWSEAGNAGLLLLRRLMDWARSDPWVRALSFSPNNMQDERTRELLQHVGLTDPSITWTWFRGASISG